MNFKHGLMGLLRTPNKKKVLKKFFSSQSPSLLIGFGITGWITSEIATVFATKKALGHIEAEKVRLDKVSLTKKETFSVVWKDFVPVVAIGSISTLCVFSGTRINAKRTTALAAAYGLSQNALTEYRDKTIQMIGKEKESVIRDGVALDNVNRVVDTPIITGTGNVLCWDVMSSRMFLANRNSIDRAINSINRMMNDEMYVELNDLYYELGIESTGAGAVLGWNVDDGSVTASISSGLSKQDEPYIVLDFLVRPKASYKYS